MSKLKKDYLLQTLFLTIVIGVLGAWGYFSLFPHHYFEGYPLIPIFYYLCGYAFVSIMDRSQKTMRKHILMIYLLMRVSRMLLSIIIAVFYCIVIREEAKEFLLTFMLNYIVYLVYDSWFFSICNYKYDVLKK